MKAKHNKPDGQTDKCKITTFLKLHIIEKITPNIPRYNNKNMINYHVKNAV